MTTTIERPAWATTTHDEGLSDDPLFTRQLEAHASLATTLQTIGTRGDNPYRFGFELTQRGDDAMLLESDELPAVWFTIADPGAARRIAAALVEAADEWEGIIQSEHDHKFARRVRDCMERSGVDLATLASAVNMPVDEFDAILAAEIVISVSHVAISCRALGVDPAELWPMPATESRS